MSVSSSAGGTSRAQNRSVENGELWISCLDPLGFPWVGGEPPASLSLDVFGVSGLESHSERALSQCRETGGSNQHKCWILQVYLLFLDAPDPNPYCELKTPQHP